MSSEFGTSTTIHVTDSDLKTQCPGCYTDSTIKTGTIHIDGSPQDVHKCTSCNRLYSKPEGTGGVQQLIDEVKSEYPNVENVTYTSSIGSNVFDNIQNATDASINANVDTYQLEQELQMLKGEMSGLNGNIINLAFQIQQLIEKNEEAMEKQIGDPLIGLRKSIFDFNLE